MVGATAFGTFIKCASALAVSSVLPAADTQYGRGFLGDGAQPVDLILRTFAAKRGDFY